MSGQPAETLATGGKCLLRTFHLCVTFDTIVNCVWLCINTSEETKLYVQRKWKL
jgi:hypothetical protein